MNKRILIGIVLMIISMILITTSNASFALKMNLIGSESTVKVGEEFEVTIKFSEKVMATNFMVDYNSTDFQYISSETEGLETAVLNGKIACIYADINGVGTDTFKLKFKALKETNSADFKTEEVKVRAVGQSASYTAEDIEGVEESLKVTISNKTTGDNTSTSDKPSGDNTSTGDKPSGDNTSTGDKPSGDNTSTGDKPSGDNTSTGDKPSGDNTSTGDKPSEDNTSTGDKPSEDNTSTGDKASGDSSQQIQQISKQDSVSSTTANKAFPKAGNNNTIGYILMVCSVLLIISGVSKYKEKELKQIFKAGGLMLVIGIVVVSNINKPVFATSEQSTTSILFYNSLMSNKYNVTIKLAKNKNSITKSELIALNTNITEVTSKDNTPLGNNDLVKTGDIVKVDLNEYNVILYGDANSDGIICDEYDLKYIKNDYLGKTKLANEEKLATNLENSDNILDTDDLSKMINKHLGKDIDLVTNTPTGNIEAIKVQGINITREGSNLTAKVVPDNATCQDIIWESSNNSVATIDDGVLDILGEGTAILTARSVANSNISSSYTANVTKHTHIGNSDSYGGCYTVNEGTRTETTYCGGCKTQINYCDEWIWLHTDQTELPDGKISGNFLCPIHDKEVYMTYSLNASDDDYIYALIDGNTGYVKKSCPCQVEEVCPGHSSTVNVYGLGCGKTEGQLLLELKEN